MKNSILLLVGVAALSLASCSQEKTADTTTVTTPADGTATTTTTTTVSDATYHTRGDRMATRFASQHKISDQATLEKLKTAYYDRAKRYDEMMAKFKSDTAGMAEARRQYNQANDQEFQTILVVPAQYQAYQSSSADYDEASNLDVTEQGADASSMATPDSSTTTTTTTSTVTEETAEPSTMGSGVAKGKSKMTDGSKVKVKGDGTVKVKDAAGNKAKM